MPRRPIDSAEASLAAPRPQFFMSLRDLAFWVRSARADARLAALQKEHGIEHAFELLYGHGADPWGATVSHFRYQRLKYERLLSLLPARHYAAALDLGCGLGPFTRHLAPHAEQVLGVDVSASAVHQARGESTHLPNVAYREGSVLEIGPEFGGPFDLVVLADVLYYLSPLTDDVLADVAARLEPLLAPGAILLLANHCFFGFDADSKTTRRIHQSFATRSGWRVVRERWRPFYLATVLERR